MNVAAHGSSCADAGPMVVVPGGTYEIGCDPHTYRRFHRVSVFRDRLRAASWRKVTIEAFQISIFPVTNLEFEQVVPAHRRSKYTPDDDHPVVDVTFYEALEYCAARAVRLPTAAEWEVAARGPANYAYSNAPTCDHGLCNFYPSEGPNRMRRYPPNGFGLFDMCGNVLEMTATKLPLHDEDFIVIAKGGSWGTCQYGTFAGAELYVDPMLRSNRIGFRTCTDAVE